MPLTHLLSPVESIYEVGFTTVPALDLYSMLDKIFDVEDKDFYRNFDQDPVMSGYSTPEPMTNTSEDSLVSIMDFSGGGANAGNLDFAMEAAIAIRALATPPRSKTPTESFTSSVEHKEVMMEDVEMCDVGLLSPVEMSPIARTKNLRHARAAFPTFDVDVKTSFGITEKIPLSIYTGKPTAPKRPRKVLAPRGPNTSYRSMPYYQSGRNLRSGRFPRQVELKSKIR